MFSRINQSIAKDLLSGAKILIWFLNVFKIEGVWPPIIEWLLPLMFHEYNRWHDRTKAIYACTMEGSYLLDTRRSSSCDASEDGITTQLSKSMDGALLDLRQVQIKHGEETDGVFWKYASILCTPAKEKSWGREMLSITACQRKLGQV